MKKPWWQFWKKEKPKVLVVPENEVLGIYELIDNFYSKPAGEDRVARYILWKAIHKLFPETKEGNWTLNQSEATKITITENLS